MYIVHIEHAVHIGSSLIMATGLHACMHASMYEIQQCCSPYHQRKCQKATGMIIPHSLCSLHPFPRLLVIEAHIQGVTWRLHATVEWTSTSACCMCLPYAFFFWKGFMPFNKEVPITGSTRRSTHGSLFYSFFFLHKSPFGHFVNALHAFEILCWQCRCFISYRQKF